MADKDYYNDTSNTAAGINTPADHEDSAPTDMIEEAVKQIVDQIQDDFDGPDNERDKGK